MSIFDSEQNIRTPEEKAKNQAQMVRRQTSRLVDRIVRDWTLIFDMLWNETDGVTPEQKLTELDTEAVELLDESAALIVFLNERLTGKGPTAERLLNEVNSRAASVPPYTKHADGTVTLDA